MIRKRDEIYILQLYVKPRFVMFLVMVHAWVLFTYRRKLINKLIKNECYLYGAYIYTGKILWQALQAG
jgi:hypothetical protein